MTDTTIHPRAAREQIIEVANRHRAAQRYGGEMLSMKDINLAVAIVRRNKLVEDEILLAAGFRAKGRK